MGERLRGDEWFKIREEILERDGKRCVNCSTKSNLVIHHIVPISSRGTNQASNLVTLCRDCHRSAHNHRVRETDDSSTQTSSRTIFTVDEVSSAINSVNHPLYTAVILITAKTGIGLGELCNLNLNDIDLGLDYSTLNTDFKDSGMQIRYGGDIPYNNRRERNQTTIVPIDSELERALKRWLAVRPDHPENDSLFTKTREEWGTRIDPSTVRYIFKKVGQSNGFYSRDNQMENFTPVALRFFFEERFRGQPKYREYILGRIGKSAIDFSSLEQNYRKSIFQLSTRSQTA